MDSVEQVIANIRARNVELTTEGDKIVASRPLLPDERKVFEENRSEAVALLNAAPAETIEQAYQRGLKGGYAAGVRDTLEEMKARPGVESRPGPPPKETTIEQEVENFVKWQAQRPSYWKWEIECVQALREAMAPGDKTQPMFAYSCLIIGVDGKEREFKRTPKRK